MKALSVDRADSNVVPLAALSNVLQELSLAAYAVIDPHEPSDNNYARKELTQSVSSHLPTAVPAHTRNSLRLSAAEPLGVVRYVGLEQPGLRRAPGVEIRNRARWAWTRCSVSSGKHSGAATSFRASRVCLVCPLQSLTNTTVTRKGREEDNVVVQSVHLARCSRESG